MVRKNLVWITGTYALRPVSWRTGYTKIIYPQKTLLKQDPTKTLYMLWIQYI